MKLKFAVSIAGLIPGLGIQAQVEFEEVTAQAGLRTAATWKYGGPTLADLNGDGMVSRLASIIVLKASMSCS